MSDDAGAPILTRTAVVQTTNGPVRGYAEGGLQVFKGLRYGAPPEPLAKPPPCSQTITGRRLASFRP